MRHSTAPRLAVLLLLPISLISQVLAVPTLTTPMLQSRSLIYMPLCFTLSQDSNFDSRFPANRPKKGACFCSNPSEMMSKVYADNGFTVERDKADLAKEVANYIGDQVNANNNGNQRGPTMFGLKWLDNSRCIRMGPMSPSYCCTGPCPDGMRRNRDNMCVDNCKNNEILCNDMCYERNRFTCVSDMPVPKRRRRDNLPLDKTGRAICQEGYTACPVGADGLGWECLQTQTEIESCGGCSSHSSFHSAVKIGEDCTAIPRVDMVSCVRGACVVESCEEGYAPTSNNTRCELASRFFIQQ